MASGRSESQSDKRKLEEVDDTPFNEVDNNLGDIMEMLRGLNSKWDFIATNLRLRVASMDIIREENKNNTERCFLFAITDWLKLNYDYVRNGKPSWRMLAKAVQSLDGSIFEKIVEEHPAGRLVSVPEEANVPAKIERQNLAKIKGSFANLILRLTRNLEGRDINMKDFRLYVVNLFPPGDIFSNKLSLSDIFETVSRHQLWNYSYYTPIEQILNEFGENDPEMKEKMKDYKSELTGFNATTKIVDYIDACDYRDEDIADPDDSLRQNMARYDKRYCRKLKVKLHIPVTDKSLDYIDLIWSSIAEHFVLPSLSVILDSIHRGCVAVTWYVPSFYALQIQANISDSTDFFQANKVIQLVMDDQVLYDEIGMDKKLLLACEEGEVDDVLALLTYGVNVDVEDQDMITPLHVAARVGNLEILNVLVLEYNATVNKQDKNGYTPLMVASLNGKLDAVQFLLECGGGDANLTTENWTALSLACHENILEIVRVLLLHYASPNAHEKAGGADILSLSQPHEKVHKWLRSKLEDKLITAANDNDLAAVKQSLEFGVDPNAIENDEYKWSALLWACEKGHNEIVEYLLEHGADPNIEDVKGWRGLILASRKGHLFIVRKLLDKGADVNMSTTELWTGLMWTAQEGHTEVAKLLLKRGADPIAKDKAGYTPLIQACQCGHLSIVKMLVEHESQSQKDIDDQRTSNDWSALMVASKKGHEDIVDYLVAHGADVNLQKEDEITALHIASYKGLNNIVRNLWKKKANIDLQDLNGLTPLMYAAKEGKMDTVRILVENAHADVNLCENDNHWTALFFAIEGHQHDVTDYLLRIGRVDIAHKDKNGYSVVDVAKSINPEAMDCLLKYHKEKTEAIAKETHAKPLNIKIYGPMIERTNSKIKQEPRPIASGA